MKKQKLIFISLIMICFAITGCDIINQTVTENLYNEPKNNENIEKIEWSKEINYIEYENKKYSFKIKIPNTPQKVKAKNQKQMK